MWVKTYKYFAQYMKMTFLSCFHCFMFNEG